MHCFHLKILFGFLIVALAVLAYHPVARAQEDRPDNSITSKPFSVEFVAAISSSDDIDQDPGIGTRVFDWIFGEETNSLIRPVALIADRSGGILLLDQGRQNLIKIDRKKKKFESIFDSDDDYFPSLVGICKGDGSGIFFTDSSKNLIMQIGHDRKSAKNFNRDITLQQPTGLAYHRGRKEVWVVETKAHSLAVLDKNGNFLRRIGRRGTRDGEFNYPTSIWIDHAGLIYVVDSMNFRVQILDEGGGIRSVFGETGDATGYFARPKGIATDTHGHIYVTDALFNAVQIFDKKGKFLYTFGRQGRGNGEFWLPSGIYIDQSNYIYVADSYNSRIQIFRLVSGENKQS